jgi:hypothetical protein
MGIKTGEGKPRGTVYGPFQQFSCRLLEVRELGEDETPKKTNGTEVKPVLNRFGNIPYKYCLRHE